MWSLALASVRANKRRLFGTSLSVLFSVAFLAGTIVLGDTMSNGFDAAYGSFNSTTDVIVRSTSVVGTDDSEQRRPVPASLADRLPSVDGVKAAAPQIQGISQLVDSSGIPMGGDGPPTIGGSWIDGPLNPFVLKQGRAPRGAGEIVIDQGTAKAGKLRVGSTTTVLAPGSVPVEVVGIAAVDDVESLGGATFTFFAPDVARTILLGGRDEASAIVISAEDGVDPATLRRRIAAAIPEGTEALTGDQLTAEQVDAVGADFLDFLRGFLLVFSGVAMLVATFSINNTFSVLIAQRARESGLLRAVGATRRQVVTMIAIESAVLGLVASVAGAFAGLGLAQGFLLAFGAMGLDLPTDGLAVQPAGLALAAAVGFVTTLFAGLFPAIEAGRIPPIAALRSAAAEARTVSRLRSAAGAALLTVGAGAIAASGLGWWKAPIAAIACSAVALLVGMVVIGPLVARRAAAVIGAPLERLRGVTGGLARQNAMRSPRRTARTAAALMVGVGVVTLFTVFGSSLVASVDDAVAGSLRADFVVSSVGFSGPGLDPDLGRDLRDLDEVAEAVALERGAVRIGKASTDLLVIDTGSLDRVIDADVTEGSFAAVTGDAVALSESYSAENGRGYGDTFDVTFGDGAERTVRVAAIFAKSEILEDMVMPTETWAAHRAQPSVRRIFINTAAGVGSEDARRAIDAVGKPTNTPVAMDRAEFVDDVAGEIGEVLSVIYVLLALSVVIALMGIANTISLSVHERRGEIGLLRAVGQVRGETRAMVRWEAAVISVFGTIGGVGLGLVAAWGLVSALSTDADLGSFAAPVGQLVIIGLIGGLVGIAAGVRPARRAARLNVLDAIGN